LKIIFKGAHFSLVLISPKMFNLRVNAKSLLVTFFHERYYLIFLSVFKREEREIF